VAILYQPYWCEENAWHLCQAPEVVGERFAVLVTPQGGEVVALWAQRAASAAEAPVGWDYHALVLARGTDGWWAWDPDHVPGMPVRAGAWLDASFPAPRTVRERHQPRFRVVPGATYVAGLRSDRSHMRAADGGWRQPPPPWPAPGDGGMNLHEWLAPNGGPGERRDLAGMRALIER
jgi:hypothetical protein